MTMQCPPPKLPETGFLRARQLVRDFLPFSEPTLWRWVKEGKFPKPHKFSSKVTAWRVEDVRAWFGSSGDEVTADE